VKIQLLSAALLASLAFPLVAMPKVTCELMYIKRAANDATDDFQRGSSVQASLEGAQISNNGFTLVAKIEEMRAQGSHPMPVFGHTLAVTISKGESSAYMSTALPKDDQFHRYSSMLRVGNLEGFANCDLH